MSSIIDFLTLVPLSTWTLRGASLLLCLTGLHLYRRRQRPMRVITVIDGDTVMALDQKGNKRKLRIKGIDCPELGQRCSFEAKEFAEQLVLGKWAMVTLYGRDKYRRDVARVRIGRKNLAKELVSAGLAFPLKGSGFGRASLWARVSGQGVWRGFGQAKPWDADSRTSFISQALNTSKSWRQARKIRLEERHRRNKQRSAKW